MSKKIKGYWNPNNGGNYFVGDHVNNATIDHIVSVEGCLNGELTGMDILQCLSSDNELIVETWIGKGIEIHYTDIL